MKTFLQGHWKKRHVAEIIQLTQFNTTYCVTKASTQLQKPRLYPNLTSMTSRLSKKRNKQNLTLKKSI